MAQASQQNRPSSNPVKAGERAPHFVSKAIDGSDILVPQTGKVWLCLFRFAACPFCNARVHQLSLAYDAITAAGVKLVVVMPSSPDRIAKYTAKYQPKFAIVSDPELSIYRTYGAETSIVGELRTAANLPRTLSTVMRYPTNVRDFDPPISAMPAEFLLEGDTVARVLYGRTLYDGFLPEEVIAWGK